MKVSVIQPSYVPWLGYFYMIQKSDIFIYYDTVQYDNGGWRNRNRVLCGDNIKWLTLSLNKKSMPCNLSERHLNRIELKNDCQFSQNKNTLYNYYHSYKNLDILNRLYPENLGKSIMICDSLVEHNNLILDYLNIKTKILRASEINYGHITTGDNKNRNLLNLLKAVEATQYISGLSAKAYMDLKLFEEQKINVLWNNYQPHDKDTLSCIHYLLAEGRQKVLEYLS